MSDAWLATDEVTDVVSSLRHAWRCAIEAETDPDFWKWAIVAIHMALQGTLVCHLSGPAHVGALGPGPKLDAWLMWKRDPSHPRPKEPTVAALDTLLTRLQGKSSRIELAGAVMALTAGEARDIRILRGYRNQIMHNRSSAWVIARTELSRLTASIASIIHRIAEQRWAFRQATSEQELEILACLRALMDLMPQCEAPEAPPVPTPADEP